MSRPRAGVRQYLRPKGAPGVGFLCRPGRALVSILRFQKPTLNSPSTRGKSSGLHQAHGTTQSFRGSPGAGAAGMTMTRFSRFDPFQVAITLFGAAFFVGLSLFY